MLLWNLPTNIGEYHLLYICSKIVYNKPVVLLVMCFWKRDYNTYSSECQHFVCYIASREYYGKFSFCHYSALTVIRSRGVRSIGGRQYTEIPHRFPRHDLKTNETGSCNSNMKDRTGSLNPHYHSTHYCNMPATNNLFICVFHSIREADINTVGYFL